MPLFRIAGLSLEISGSLRKDRALPHIRRLSRNSTERIATTSPEPYRWPTRYRKVVLTLTGSLVALTAKPKLHNCACGIQLDRLALRKFNYIGTESRGHSINS